MLSEVRQEKLRTKWFPSYVVHKTESSTWTDKKNNKNAGMPTTVWLPEGREGSKGWRGADIWRPKMIWLWVMGTQYNIRSCIVEVYTRNLDTLFNQCHTSKLKVSKKEKSSKQCQAHGRISLTGNVYSCYSHTPFVPVDRVSYFFSIWYKLYIQGTGLLDWIMWDIRKE